MARDRLAAVPDLHDSEINGSIEWFFDGAWNVLVGHR
jgi:hypothetical protein